MDKEPGADKVSGLKLTKKQVVIILLLFAVLLVAVGLLVGLIKPTCSSLSVRQPAESTAKTVNGRTADPWLNGRLPRHVIPFHYELSLFPDFYQPEHEARFHGNVSILINITSKPTSHLIVHAHRLTIHQTSVRLHHTSDINGEVPVKRTFKFTQNQYWVVELERALQPGATVWLEMRFEGSLIVGGLAGMYRTSYVDSRTGQTRYLSTTKFQPTDARRAFPCFDEPIFKSTFRTTLIHRPDYTALSNMPVQSTRQHSSELVATTFQTSVPMVTYLACFIVCDFAYKEYTTTRGVSLRVYASPDKVEQTEYALNISVKILTRFEELFGLQYPLPKLDQISIPEFSSGAMENWGLVTYRERNLLYDAGVSSPSDKQRVAAVVAHELAHMWFGNLVTMEWWNDIWLNEGFARYFEYVGVDSVHPEWLVHSQFVSKRMISTMKVDARPSSHPVVDSVSTPGEIAEMFDTITYNKGACLVRMMRQFLGDDAFYQGLQAYVSRHQYDTVTSNNLWQALSSAANVSVDVKSVMDTWTLQSGFPIVHVSVFGRQVKLRQERFLPDRSADKTQPPSDYNYLWRIPVSWRTSDGHDGLWWLTRREETFQIPQPLNSSTSDWLKLNLNETAYMRVNYMQSNWRALANALRRRHTILSISDRTGLLDNAFTAAGLGLVDYDVAIDLAHYLAAEDHQMPWKAFVVNVQQIDDMLIDSHYYSHWQAYKRELVRPALQRIGFDDTGDHLNRRMRTVLLSLACSSADQSSLQHVSKLFLAWLNNDTYIPPGLRKITYSYGMQEECTEEIWDKVWNIYLNTSAPAEKHKLLKALARTRLVWIIHRLLVYADDETKIRSQDFFSVVNYLSRNPVARPHVWNWARSNWQRLVRRFSLENRYLGRMIPSIVKNFNTQFQLQEVLEFFKQFPDAGAGARERRRAVEKIRSNIDWVTQHRDDITNWLYDHITQSH